LDLFELLTAKRTFRLKKFYSLNFAIKKEHQFISKKLLHIITDLDRGGAEFFLYRLVTKLNKSHFSNKVVTLKPSGEIAEKLNQKDIEVHSLNLSKTFPSPFALLELNKIIKKNKPDLIQTWMYHADLLGGLVGKLFSDVPILWSLRQSTINPKTTRLRTILIIKLCARLSKWIPDHIVANSRAGLKAHQAHGYKTNKLSVIPNGYDSNTFQPDSEARKSVRQELGLDPDTPLIGLVARFHPQKDHETFFRAAGRLADNNRDVHFLLCGRNVTPDNQQIMTWVHEQDVTDQVHLLGERDDIPRIQASLDIATSSSSYAEGNPNVIGEAMASGVPCVVTDVGDSARLIGETGRVVSSENPDELAEAWAELLSLSKEERKRLGIKARKRIQEHFSLEQIVTKFKKLYKKLIRSKSY
jgi:glycosyltransferase involved in cell wall biosynthesis